MKRDFENRCAALLRRNGMSRALAGSLTTIASAHQPPFFVPPKESTSTPRFHVGGIIKGGCATPLAPEVIAAYDAPFPDDRYLAGARQFPVLVPTTPDNPASEANRAAWQALRRFDKPFLTAFSDRDAVTAGYDTLMQRDIPGCQGQAHTTIANGGHFLQEDQGEQLAQVVNDFIKRN